MISGQRPGAAVVGVGEEEAVLGLDRPAPGEGHGLEAVRRGDLPGEHLLEGGEGLLDLLRAAARVDERRVGGGVWRHPDLPHVRHHPEGAVHLHAMAI